MLRKTYNPAEGAENLRLTIHLATQEEPVELDSFPYSTEDSGLQRILDRNKLLTTQSEEEVGPKATDAARRKADEAGVNLDDVSPSGASGQVTVEDVEGHAQG